MKLLLQRETSTDQSTPGKLYVDGQFSCYALEDVMREIPGRPVAEWKEKGMTAIPAGQYKLAYTFSNRFQRKTLILLNVPGFDGIRVHGGNDSGDTEGCPLLGRVRLSADRIRDCAPAIAAVEEKVVPLLEAGEDVWIEVANPAPPTM